MADSEEKNRPQEDIFARVDYRRLIAWPARIQRESPFLLEALGKLPFKRVLDLGCGTGEHSRFLAESGFDVLGIDRSESMLQKARMYESARLKFVLGDLQKLTERVDGRYGGAICLGNTLVHLTSRQEMSGALVQLASVLSPGGLFLFQILNYERIFKEKIRYLPLNIMENSESGGETIFLRLLEPLEEGMIRFCPTTLHYDPQLEPPLQVEQSRIVEQRGWTRPELEEMLEEAGFQMFRCYGDMTQGEYDPVKSNDLVVVAKKND